MERMRSVLLLRFPFLLTRRTVLLRSLTGVLRARLLAANKPSETDGLRTFDAGRRSERSARQRWMRKRCAPKDAWTIAKGCERTSDGGSTRKTCVVHGKTEIDERPKPRANKTLIA